jgi:hypothetical protein
MNYPWEAKPVRPELVKDPITGLYPGQRDPDDSARRQRIILSDEQTVRAVHHLLRLHRGLLCYVDRILHWYVLRTQLALGDVK